MFIKSKQISHYWPAGCKLHFLSNHHRDNLSCPKPDCVHLFILCLSFNRASSV
jgi:hypothetical protein